jgi:hypothetical protein
MPKKETKMKRPLQITVLVIALFVTTSSLVFAAGPGKAPAWPAGEPPVQHREPDPAYLEAIRKTANMVWDQVAQNLAASYDLNIVNVTWEDTGRYYNSSVGPNISDVTIQVQHWNPELEQYELTLMPVIRYPNFSDLTADISPDDFYLLVGNENGEGLHKVTLTEYLGNFRHYLNDPDSWAGDEVSLLADRDSHVLVSAQAAFLPIPREGQAEFNPVIFNYQSCAQNPAVLTIVATREGTSATIIDNVRDGFPAGWSWGQRLFFNENGMRASLTGQRLSDFAADNPEASGDTPEAAGASGLNMVLLIQVPLKQKQSFLDMLGFGEGAVLPAAAPMEEAESDVEAAVIGHGAVEGPFTEIDGLKIERDERFPIRVTVQFYKATSNGVVSAGDMEEIAGQINRVYEEADYVGSLVIGGPSERPTEYDGSKDEPAGWWDAFWKHFEQNIGLTAQEARDLLRSLGAYTGRWWAHVD